MNRFFLTVCFICIGAVLFSCIPDGIEKQMNEGMKKGITMLSDQQFKNAVGLIELHKLRNGKYPSSLNELQYLNEMDSITLASVNYSLLPEGYELNVVGKFPTFDSADSGTVELAVPEGFWKGLGCKRTNVKTVSPLIVH